MCKARGAIQDHSTDGVYCPHEASDADLKMHDRLGGAGQAAGIKPERWASEKG